jgi:hypothetical protein
MSDWQRLWQSQSQREPTMSLEQIREKAQRFEGVIYRRSRREYVAGTIGIFGFLRLLWIGPTTTIRIGAALTIVGGALVLYLLRKWGSTAPLPEALALQSAIEFHRAQLERQRDLLRSVVVVLDAIRPRSSRHTGRHGVGAPRANTTPRRS